jgi:hypothetical protein
VPDSVQSQFGRAFRVEAIDRDVETDIGQQHLGCIEGDIGGQNRRCE